MTDPRKDAITFEPFAKPTRWQRIRGWWRGYEPVEPFKDVVDRRKQHSGQSRSDGTGAGPHSPSPNPNAPVPHYQEIADAEFFARMDHEKAARFDADLRRRAQFDQET